MSLDSMLLKRGITSFFNWDDWGTIPEFAYAEFKRVVYGVADPLCLAVSELNERGVTPNFHSARLDGANAAITILGHSTYPIFAFAEPIEFKSCHLCFVDHEPLSRVIETSFPGTSIATAGELNRQLAETDLTKLDASELEQIEYWKPKTVGEVAFNWWD